MSTRYLVSAACALLAVGTAAADTINVPADHGTIGAALAAAKDGDTVLIKKGRYAESVVLDGMNNVTIRAKGKVIIDPAMGPGLHVRNCTGVTVQGIRVEDAEVGFVIETCTDVELARFRATGVDGFGVLAVASSNVKLTSGKIDDCGGDGVSFADGESESAVTGGTITKVNASNCGDDGFDLLGSDVDVVRCKATNCGDDGFESDEDGLGPVRFEKCKASDTDDEGFELGAPATTCVKCKTKDTDDDGFDIEADNCVLEKCKAKGADEAGFSIDQIDNAQLTACKATKCGEQGFDFYYATNAKLAKCKAMKTAGDGFRLDAFTQGCDLEKCKGKKSGEFDLIDASGGANTFTKCKFKKEPDFIL